jgi:hypothetical protein
LVFIVQFLKGTASTGLPKGRIGTIDIFYSALDCIPRNFEGISITPAVTLVLPLTIIFLPHDVTENTERSLGLDWW